MANKYSRSGGINTMKNKHLELMNLETILVSLGCKKPFKKNGDISKDGWKAYNKLMSILIFLEDNNVINFRQDNLDSWVDEVVETKI